MEAIQEGYQHLPVGSGIDWGCLRLSVLPEIDLREAGWDDKHPAEEQGSLKGKYQLLLSSTLLIQVSTFGKGLC